jgi:hypothetical protein
MRRPNPPLRLAFTALGLVLALVVVFVLGYGGMGAAHYILGAMVALVVGAMAMLRR